MVEYCKVYSMLFSHDECKVLYKKNTVTEGPNDNNIYLHWVIKMKHLEEDLRQQCRAAAKNVNMILSPDTC